MSQFADSMVTELNNKNVKWLIIDVRANGGGDSRVGDELLKRISPTSFTQFGSVYMKASEATLRLTPDRADNVGLYYFVVGELIEPLEESKRFKGRPFSSQATGLFLQRLHFRGLTNISIWEQLSAKRPEA